MAVTLTRAFLIGETEVTLEQWMAADLPTPAYPINEGGCPTADFPCTEPCVEPNCPVAGVNWYEALTYANLLSERHDPPLAPCYRLWGCRGEIGRGDYACGVEATGIVYGEDGLPSYVPPVYDCEGFRLPTDAEWEYAARAGTGAAFYSGDVTAYGEWLQNFTTCRPDANLERIGWYCWNSGGRAHPVKGREPNAWGLYDMAGNVAEWNNDGFDGLGARSSIDPDGRVATPTTSRNVRGGWFGLWASACRMADQGAETESWRGFHLGFRLVRTLR
jgi:formylglycine-generating enzyme required for sulfatase activity